MTNSNEVIIQSDLHTPTNDVNWKEDIEAILDTLELRVEDCQSRFEFEYIGHKDQSPPVIWNMITPTQHSINNYYLPDYNPTRKHTCRCKKWQNCFKCKMASKSQRILNQ